MHVLNYAASLFLTKSHVVDDCRQHPDGPDLNRGNLSQIQLAELRVETAPQHSLPACEARDLVGDHLVHDPLPLRGAKLSEAGPVHRGDGVTVLEALMLMKEISLTIYSTGNLL